MKSFKLFFLFSVLLGFASLFQNEAIAQEFTTALPVDLKNNLLQKPTTLSLPFFDDFTDADDVPNPTLWNNKGVYLSNTMTDKQFSRGVAVFDATNLDGQAYDSTEQHSQVWADSLSSQAIDLSTYSPADSLWLSFFYEAGGNGFAPKMDDSFCLFFLNKQNKWIKVWKTHPFSSDSLNYQMIAITDSDFFHSGFSFRFVNKAIFGISNSTWILDFVYLDKSRTSSDSAINEVAFTIPPTPLLKDYRVMPYPHFKTNPTQFSHDSVFAFIRNNGSMSANLTYGFEAKEIATGNSIGSGTGNQLFPGYEVGKLTFPSFSLNNLNATGNKAKVETKFFTNSLYSGESTENDTIISHQLFDDYFAYDDGTAELAYFLKVFNDAPAITAVEYELFIPDTLRGVSIYFPRTVPLASNKEFSLIVYKDIAVNGGKDEIIYQQDYYLPELQLGLNQFHTYSFDHPVAMESGIYYIGLMQAAGGYSDSLYIGLDIHKKNGNYRYFNVEGIWESSQIDGAVMIRPVVGQALPPHKINTDAEKTTFATVYPNPAKDDVYLQTKGNSPVVYEIIDASGRILLKGTSQKELTQINIRNLSKGLYYLKVSNHDGREEVYKLLKK